MIYPLVRDLAASEIPVVVTCRVLGFSPQAFYQWRANPVSMRDWSDAHLVDAALQVHADDPVFGYRFIADELEAEHGISASENRVHRLCSQHGISSVLARRRGRGMKPGPAVHDDLVRRDFTADAPNELWLTDITEHRTAEGKLYLCAIKDAFSGRIVGYSIDSRMKASLAVAALRNAIGLRSPAGTVVHSDRGSQFRGGWSRRRRCSRANSRHRLLTSRYDGTDPCALRTSAVSSDRSATRLDEAGLPIYLLGLPLASVTREVPVPYPLPRETRSM